jgi:hypothetical protein
VILYIGAADKPRRAESRRLSLPGVGLIRVVMRRFAPRKQRMESAAPLSRARSVRDNQEFAQGLHFSILPMRKMEKLTLSKNQHS